VRHRASVAYKSAKDAKSKTPKDRTRPGMTQITDVNATAARNK